MSHEVKLHEAQTSILRELLFAPQAGFAELQKPTGLTSDHFMFHVNRLMEIGFVEKIGRGQYRLTIAGKEYANRLDTDERTIERQAKISVLVVPVRLRGGEGGPVEYMMQRRLKQPFFGRYGFTSGKIRWGETIAEGAARELMEEAGLRAELTLKCLYHKLDYTTAGHLLEDKHFYILEATAPEGNFKPQFDSGSNHWHTIDEIQTLDNKFPGVFEVIERVHQSTMTLWEEKYTHKPEDY